MNQSLSINDPGDCSPGYRACAPMITRNVAHSVSDPSHRPDWPQSVESNHLFGQYATLNEAPNSASALG